MSKASDLTPQDLPAKKQFRGIYDCCGRQPSLPHNLGFRRRRRFFSRAVFLVLASANLSSGCKGLCLSNAQSRHRPLSTRQLAHSRPDADNAAAHLVNLESIGTKRSRRLWVLWSDRAQYLASLSPYGPWPCYHVVLWPFLQLQAMAGPGLDLVSGFKMSKSGAGSGARAFGYVF